MTFLKRRIVAKITLGHGVFGDTTGDVITIDNHAIAISMNAFGGNSQGELRAKIYGLSLSLINKITTVGPIMSQIRGQNKIEVTVNGALLFTGYIWQAFGEFKSQPNVFVNIHAYSSLPFSVKPASITSFKKDTSVATIMKVLAGKAGLKFLNDGVTKSLPNPYFSGSALDQIKEVAESAKINYVIEDDTLTIWGRTKPRSTPSVPIISPGTNMVGYPSYSSNGITLKSLFIPELKLGGRIVVQGSQFISANGSWITFKVSHSLSARIANGDWFTEIEAWYHGK